MLNVLKSTWQYPQGHIRISLSTFLHFLTSFIRIYSYAISRVSTYLIAKARSKYSRKNQHGESKEHKFNLLPFI